MHRVVSRLFHLQPPATEFVIRSTFPTYVGAFGQVVHHVIGITSDNLGPFRDPDAVLSEKCQWFRFLDVGVQDKVTAGGSKY